MRVLVSTGFDTYRGSKRNATRPRDRRRDFLRRFSPCRPVAVTPRPRGPFHGDKAEDSPRRPDTAPTDRNRREAIGKKRRRINDMELCRSKEAPISRDTGGRGDRRDRARRMAKGEFANAAVGPPVPGMNERANARGSGGRSNAGKSRDPMEPSVQDPVARGFHGLYFT